MAKSIKGYGDPCGYYQVIFREGLDVFAERFEALLCARSYEGYEATEVLLKTGDFVPIKEVNLLDEPFTVWVNE